MARVGSVFLTGQAWIVVCKLAIDLHVDLPSLLVNAIKVDMHRRFIASDFKNFRNKEVSIQFDPSVHYHKNFTMIIWVFRNISFEI